MTGLELIEKYPLAAKVIKDWFLTQMIESLNNESIDEEFKNFMREQGVEDDKMGTLIELNPRMLFDVFDDNNIRIHIVVGSDVSADNYSFHIASGIEKKTRSEVVKDLKNDFKTRKEAELKSIEYAFEILENKLTPVELPNLKNDEK
jgi:hypothetical protein